MPHGRGTGRAPRPAGPGRRRCAGRGRRVDPAGRGPLPGRASSEAADVAVLKVQPLGGVRACLEIAERIGLPVVVSSALETSVGIARRGGPGGGAARPAVRLRAEHRSLCSPTTWSTIRWSPSTAFSRCATWSSTDDALLRNRRRRRTTSVLAGSSRADRSELRRTGRGRMGEATLAAPRWSSRAARRRGAARSCCAGIAQRTAGVRAVRGRQDRAAPAARPDRRADRRFPGPRPGEGLRRPVAVLTTSGTAAANLHPAVLEAFHSHIPLVLITADRPRATRSTPAATRPPTRPAVRPARARRDPASTTARRSHGPGGSSWRGC